MRLVPIVCLLMLAGCAEEPADASAEPVEATSEIQPESEDVLADLPTYTVADRVNELTGGTYGDIVVPEYTTDTDTDTLAAAAKAIVEAEGLNRASFYRTADAVKANFSSSFAEANPGVLETGLLGTFENGAFTRSTP